MCFQHVCLNCFKKIGELKIAETKLCQWWELEFERRVLRQELYNQHQVSLPIMQTCVSLHQQSSRTQVQKLETCESLPIIKRENQESPKWALVTKKKKEFHVYSFLRQSNP